MNCCNNFGQCTNGKDCPIRKTARREVEELMGCYEASKTARVGKRYYAAPAYAPSHWPKTLRAWATAALAVAVFSFVFGFAVGMI